MEPQKRLLEDLRYIQDMRFDVNTGHSMGPTRRRDAQGNITDDHPPVTNGFSQIERKLRLFFSNPGYFIRRGFRRY